VLNGHGNENMVCGHENEPLLVLEENEELISSKVVYAISCKSAKKLGSNSIKRGTINYTGYSDDFIFFFDPIKASRPKDDKIAELFLKPSREFVKTLIKGNTIDTAYKKTKRMFRENIIKLLANEDASLVRFLWWDMRNFVSHGNMNTSPLL